MTAHRFKIVATALVLVLAPLATAAHHRDGHGGGNGNASEARGGNGTRGALASGEERTRPCANGLAAREVACVPPGQAARDVTTEQWIGAPFDTLDVEKVSEEADFGLVTNADRLGLPALSEGQTYAVAGGDLVIVDVVTADDGTSTYTYSSTVRRAAFPGNSNH